MLFVPPNSDISSDIAESLEAHVEGKHVGAVDEYTILIGAVLNALRPSQF